MKGNIFFKASVCLLLTAVFPSVFSYEHKITTLKQHNNLLKITTSDWDLSFGGFLILDYSKFTNDKAILGSGFKTPWSQFSINGLYQKHWSFNFSYNFSDTNQYVDSAIQSANIGYISKKWAVQVGQFAPAFGTVNSANTTPLTLITEPLIENIFTPTGSQGVNGAWQIGDVGINLAAFG